MYIKFVTSLPSFSWPFPSLFYPFPHSLSFLSLFCLSHIRLLSFSLTFLRESRNNKREEQTRRRLRGGRGEFTTVELKTRIKDFPLSVAFLIFICLFVLLFFFFFFFLFSSSKKEKVLFSSSQNKNHKDKNKGKKMEGKFKFLFVLQGKESSVVEVKRLDIVSEGSSSPSFSSLLFSLLIFLCSFSLFFSFFLFLSFFLSFFISFFLSLTLSPSNTSPKQTKVRFFSGSFSKKEK